MRKICLYLISFLFAATLIVGDLYHPNNTKPAAAIPLLDKCIKEQETAEKIEIPFCVYRADDRQPETIFTNGFELPGQGTNNNILEHMTGSSLRGDSRIPLRNTTNFISTTESEEFAASWRTSANKYRWVYAIEPDKNFFSSHISLNTAIKNSNLSINFRNNLTKMLNSYGNQLEWFAQGGIVKERVFAAIPYLMNQETGKPEANYKHMKLNPNYRLTPTKATLNSLPVTENNLCHDKQTVTKNICNWVIPENEQQLQEIHLNNIAQNPENTLEDLHFVTTPTFAASSNQSLLSPLQESNQIINDFDTTTGIDGYKNFKLNLSKSINTDLQNLEDISKNNNFINKVVEKNNEIVSTKKLFSHNNSIIPYLGIGITGYALYEDIKKQNWVDSGFDSVRLGLNILMAAEPEIIASIGEILPVLDIGQQAIDHIFTKHDFPTKNITNYDQKNLEEDIKRWNNLTQDMFNLNIDVNIEHLSKLVEQTKNEHFVASLRKNLNNDLIFLDKLQNTYLHDINRKAVAISGGTNVGKVWEEISLHRKETLENVHQHFLDKKNQRIQDYINLLQEKTQNFATSFVTNYWSSGNNNFDVFNEKFEKNVVINYIEESENLLHEHYKKNPASVALDYANKTSQDIQGEKFFEYRHLFAEESTNLANKLVFPPNNMADLDLLTKSVSLDLTNFEPTYRFNSNVLNIADEVLLSVDKNNIIKPDVCYNSSPNKKSEPPTVQISIYDQKMSLLKIYDSTGMDLTQNETCKNFYSKLTNLEADQFVVFEFANPADFVKLGKEPSFPDTLLNSTTKYVTQLVQKNFVAWMPKSLANSENTYQLKSQNGSGTLTLAEGGIRGEVAVTQDFDTPATKDWVFNYHEISGLYSINSFLNPNLFLEMDASGRIFMNDRYGKDHDKIQLWQITANPQHRNFVNITNGEYPNMRLTSKLNNHQVFAADDIDIEKDATQLWQITTVEQPLYDNIYKIESNATIQNTLEYSTYEHEFSMNHFTGDKKQQFKFTYDKTRHAYTIHPQQTICDSCLFSASSTGSITYTKKNEFDYTQLWRLHKKPNGEFIIANYKYPNLLLTNNNKNISLESSTENHTGQVWNIIPKNLRPIIDGIYRISNNFNLSYVFNYETDTRTVTTATRNDHETQQWNFSYVADKHSYIISSKYHPGMYLNFEEATNSVTLKQEFSVNMYWNLSADIEGLITFRPLNDYENKVLSIPIIATGEIENGKEIEVTSFNEKFSNTNSNQKFVLERMDSTLGVAANFAQNISIAAKPDWQLSVFDNEDGGAAVLDKNPTEDTLFNRKVMFVYNPTWKAYKIHFIDLGKFLTWYNPTFGAAHFGVDSSFDDEANSFWDIIENADGKFRFINRANPDGLLGVRDLESLDSKTESLSYDSDSESYLWDISLSLDAKNTKHILPFNGVAKNNLDDNFALHVEKDFDEGNVRMEKFTQSLPQNWVFEFDTQQHGYKIKSAYGENRFLAWDEQKNAQDLFVHEFVADDKNSFLWNVKINADNSRSFTNFLFPELCLTRKEQVLFHGVNVNMQSCNSGQLEQKWELVAGETKMSLPEVPVAGLDVSSLREVDNVRSDVIGIGGGVTLTLDTENSRFVVDTVNPDTGEAPEPVVDEMFAKSGKHTVTVYENNNNGEPSFVRAYNSGSFALSTVLGRQTFYEQIGVIADNQFLVFGFENPISFVSVGAANETRLENVKQYVVQRKDNSFVAWLPYNLIEDPVLQQTINQQINKTDLNANITQTDLNNLTTLEVVNKNIQTLDGLENATNLTALTVSDTALTFLPTNFGKLQNLQNLVLAKNRLTELPQSLGDIKSLQTLDLANNELTVLPNTLTNLSNLKQINVDNNFLANVSVFNTDIKNFSAQNQKINITDGSHFFLEGFLQIYNVLLPTSRNNSPIDVSGLGCVFIDFNVGVPPNFDPDAGCVVTDDSSVVWQSGGVEVAGYTVMVNVDKNSEQFTVPFQDPNNSFTGDIVYNIREYVTPAPPQQPVFESVGVAKVGQNVNIKLPFSFGKLLGFVEGLPSGLQVVAKPNGELFLQGKTNSVGVFDFVVETTFENQTQKNFFSFETVPENTILVKVGERLNYTERYSATALENVLGVAVFGEHSEGNLPVGVGFASTWLDKYCGFGLVWEHCWGSSEISFKGVPKVAGSYDVKVARRGVNYVRAGIWFWFKKEIFYDLGTKNYTIRIW